MVIDTKKSSVESSADVIMAILQVRNPMLHFMIIRIMAVIDAITTAFFSSDILVIIINSLFILKLSIFSI